MTRVKIEPGICGFDATVTAESADQMEVTLRVDGGCEAVQKMMQALGGTFDAYELCLTRPGSGPLYDYALAHFPGARGLSR